MYKFELIIVHQYFIIECCSYSEFDQRTNIKLERIIEDINSKFSLNDWIT